MKLLIDADMLLFKCLTGLFRSNTTPQLPDQRQPGSAASTTPCRMRHATPSE